MGVYSKEEFVEHSAIGKSFVNDLLYDDSDELYHYGRKGMKWGQHIFGKVKSGAKKAGKKTVELAKAGYKKASTATKIHAAETRAKKAADKLRKKPLKDLTDDELNARLKRLELEKRVSDLQKQTTQISAGKAILSKVGKDVLVPAAMNAGKEVLERWLKKQGYDFAGLKDTQYGTSKLEKEANEAKLRKEKANNTKQAETTEDWLKDRKEKADRKAAEERAERDIEDNIRKTEAKARKAAEKAERKAAREDRKVYTGEVSGEGTSKRKTEQPKSKPSDYYNPIETEFVNNTVSAARRSDEYRRGKALIGQLLLNP